MLTWWARQRRPRSRPGTLAPTTRSPTGAEIALDTSVWWGRFELHLGRATFAPSGYGPSGTLTVDHVVHQPTPRTGRSSTPPTWRSRSRASATRPGSAGLPEVPGGGTSGGTLGFWLPEGFDPAAHQASSSAGPTEPEHRARSTRPTRTSTFAPTPSTHRHRPHRRHGPHPRPAASLAGAASGPDERGMGLLQLSFNLEVLRHDLARQADRRHRLHDRPRPGARSSPATRWPPSRPGHGGRSRRRARSQRARHLPGAAARSNPGQLLVTYTDQLTLATATLSFTLP